MKTRRSFLTTLLALPFFGSFIGASCQLGSAIPVADAVVVDAGLVLSMITTAVNAYFDAHPNAALQVKIDDAMADAQGSLRVVQDALAVVNDFSATNVQAAIASFQTTFDALVQLIGQIGIQVGKTDGRKMMRLPDGKIIIAPPRILQQLVVKKAEFGTSVTYELERWRHDPNYIPVLPPGSNVDLLKFRRYYELSQPGWATG